MNEPADLGLSLHRQDGGRYGVELVFRLPGSEGDTSPLGLGAISVAFDHERLRAAAPSGSTYGRALGEMLLGNPVLAAAVAQAQSVAQSHSRSLRLCLAFAADATDLHAIRWETIHDPQDHRPIALREQLILTRRLGSANWQPIALRPQRSLRTLMTVAAPQDALRYGLSPIDQAAEQRRAQVGFGDMPVTTVAAPGAATADAIIGHLRDGYDILYLVAHGAMDRETPWLFLDDGQGRAAPVRGDDFAAQIADLPVKPSLIVLASCDSAGDTYHNPASALGLRLAACGIPAVLAMQGAFSITTNAAFAPAFFRELRRDGRVDRAVAVARQSVRHQVDWWVPALFTRVRNGRIWRASDTAERALDHSPNAHHAQSASAGNVTITGGTIGTFVHGAQYNYAAPTPSARPTVSLRDALAQLHLEVQRLSTEARPAARHDVERLVAALDPTAFDLSRLMVTANRLRQQGPGVAAAVTLLLQCPEVDGREGQVG